MAEENAILVNAYKAGGGGSGSGSAVEDYILDYKTFGTDSYVYNNKDVLHEVYEKSEYCMNDNKLRNEAFDYLNSIDEAGHAFAGVYGIDEAATLEKLGAMSAVAASSTAMSAVAASSTAMSAVAASSTAMSAVAQSTTALDTLYAKKKKLSTSDTFTGKAIVLEISSSNRWDYPSYGCAVLSDGSYPNWSSYMGSENKYKFFQKYPMYATKIHCDTGSGDYVYYFQIS